MMVEILRRVADRGKRASRHSLLLLMSFCPSAVMVRGLSTTTNNAAASSSGLGLQRPSLIPSFDEEDGASFTVHNPADPTSVIARVPVMGEQETRQAVAQATQALPAWRDGQTAAARGSILRAWSAAMTQHAEDLARIMTLESGKPLGEARGEVAYATSFLDYYAAEAVRPSSAGGGFLTPTPFCDPVDASPRGQVMALHQAVGVCGLITPWNFPAAMITRKVGPALAAGCTAVVKPSELTPLTALALQQLAREAGLPDGVLQIVTADRASTPDVGRTLCQHEQVRKLSFTGSTAVGKKLMAQSAATVQRLSLELGGNAAFVVFEDANVDQAVAAALASKFRNAGQTCVCADRFLIHDAVHDEFVDKLKMAVRRLKVGPGLDETTTMGPLISNDAVVQVDDKVREALLDGAQCLVGGEPLTELGPQFYAPTILTGVSTESRIWKTETFGPVAAIRSFSSEEEALSVANDSPVGLAGYFCTREMSRAFRFAKHLECGLVGVNEGIISTCSAPFGGVKESGLGREGSVMGLGEYLETKYVFLNA